MTDDEGRTRLVEVDDDDSFDPCQNVSTHWTSAICAADRMDDGRHAFHCFAR